MLKSTRCTLKAHRRRSTFADERITWNICLQTLDHHKDCKACLAPSQILNFCLDGTYCLPQHLSMGLCMFHLEKKIIKPASIWMQTCQMSEANLQLCKFMEGLLKVGHPSPFLHLELCLCRLWEALKHCANLLLPELVEIGSIIQNKYDDWHFPNPLSSISVTHIISILTCFQQGQHLCF